MTRRCFFGDCAAARLLRARVSIARNVSRIIFGIIVRGPGNLPRGLKRAEFIGGGRAALRLCQRLPGTADSSGNSRSLHSAVADAPVPVGMTECLFSPDKIRFPRALRNSRARLAVPRREFLRL